MSLRQQAEILRQVQQEVPFCNFADVLRFHGQDTPLAMGGSCLYQSTVLARRLNAEVAGACAKILGRPSSVPYANHVSVLCDVNGEKWFHEPAYLLSEPVSLSEIPREGTLYKSTLPPLTPGDAAFSANPEILVMSLIRDFRQSNIEMFDLSNTWDVPQDPFPVVEGMAKAKRNDLRIETLLTENLKITVRVSTSSGQTCIKENNSKIPQESRLFRTYFNITAANAHLSPDQLREKFRLAFEIHRDVQRKKEAEATE